MNPVIAKNMESVNTAAAMDTQVFEHGGQAKGTQGVSIEAFLRQANINSQRKEKEDAKKTWIRRNKHLIKLKSIMNRGTTSKLPKSSSVEKLEMAPGISDSVLKELEQEMLATTPERKSGYQSKLGLNSRGNETG